MTALHRILACRRGTTALEFALLFPLFLILLCGIVEATNVHAADRKIIVAAQSCADLVTQEKGVDVAKLDDIGRAVQLVMEPLPQAGLGFRITSVTFDATTGAPSITWHRIVGACVEGGRPTPTVTAPGLGLPCESFIVVDLSYQYTPLFRNIVPQGWRMDELAVARPRRVRTIACSGC